MNSFRTGHNRGFTLIELLVVIAIIGILASIVLVSLNSARDKGSDAAVKENLHGLQNWSEVYNTSNDYSGLCAASNASTSQIMTATVSASGATSAAYNAVGSATTVTCNSTTGGWAAQSPLKGGGFWCVDFTGTSTQKTSNSLTATTDTSCN